MQNDKAQQSSSQMNHDVRAPRLEPHISLPQQGFRYRLKRLCALQVVQKSNERYQRLTALRRKDANGADFVGKLHEHLLRALAEPDDLGEIR